MIEVSVYYLKWELTGVPFGAFNAVQHWDTGYYKHLWTMLLSNTELERRKIADIVFAWMNQGSGSENPDLFGNERSMSIGDIVRVDGRYFVVNVTGWFEVFLSDRK